MRYRPPSSTPSPVLTDTMLTVPTGDYPVAEIFGVEAEAPTLGTSSVALAYAAALVAMAALLAAGNLKLAGMLLLLASACAPWAWSRRGYSLVIRTKAGWVRALQTDDYQLVMALAGQLRGRLAARAGVR